MIHKSIMDKLDMSIKRKRMESSVEYKLVMNKLRENNFEQQRLQVTTRYSETVRDERMKQAKYEENNLKAVLTYLQNN